MLKPRNIKYVYPDALVNVKSIKIGLLEVGTNNKCYLVGGNVPCSDIRHMHDSCPVQRIPDLLDCGAFKGVHLQHMRQKVHHRFVEIVRDGKYARCKPANMTICSRAKMQ